MLIYSLFASDTEGIYAPARKLEFLDDAHAMSAAWAMTKEHQTIEVWLGDKLVGVAKSGSKIEASMVAAQPSQLV